MYLWAFISYFFRKGDYMDDTQLKYLDYIVRQNNAMIEQLNTLVKVIANHLELPIEEEVDDNEIG